MADTFTPLLRFVEQQDEGNVNIWGATYNASVTDLVEEAIAGRSEIDVTFENIQLTTVNGGPDQSRAMFLVATGNPGTPREIVVPSLQKLYIVVNDTAPAFNVTIKTASNAGVVVPGGTTSILFVDQVADLVRGVAVAGATVSPAAGLTDVNANVVSGASGQTTVTWSYTNQGKIIYVETGTITVTVNATTFEFNFPGGVPAAIIPGEPTSAGRDFPFIVVEAGVSRMSYLRVSPADTNWEILRADGLPWTNGSERIIRQRLHFWWDQLND